ASYGSASHPPLSSEASEGCQPKPDPILESLVFSVGVSARDPVSMWFGKSTSTGLLRPAASNQHSDKVANLHAHIRHDNDQNSRGSAANLRSCNNKRHQDERNGCGQQHNDFEALRQQRSNCQTDYGNPNHGLPSRRPSAGSMLFGSQVSPYRVNISLSGGFRNDAAKARSPKLHEPAQEPANGTIKRNFGRALSRRSRECSAAPGICPAPGVSIALGYLRNQMRLSICEGSTSLSWHVLPALSPSRQRQAVRAKRAFSRRSAFAGPRRSS